MWESFLQPHDTPGMNYNAMQHTMNMHALQRVRNNRAHARTHLGALGAYAPRNWLHVDLAASDAELLAMSLNS